MDPLWSPAVAGASKRSKREGVETRVKRPSSQPLRWGGRVVVGRPSDFCLDSAAQQIDTEIAKEELESEETRDLRRRHAGRFLVHHADRGIVNDRKDARRPTCSTCGHLVGQREAANVRRSCFRA
jgi:hypothetical protein